MTTFARMRTRTRTRMCERLGLLGNLVWRAHAFARIGRNVLVSCRLHAKMLPLAASRLDVVNVGA